MAISKYTVAESSNLALGQAGFKNVATSSSEEGRFVAIKAFNGDVEVTTENSAGDVLTNQVITQGDIVYGPFTKVTRDDTTVTAQCLAYRG